MTQVGDGDHWVTCHHPVEVPSPSDRAQRPPRSP